MSLRNLLRRILCPAGVARPPAALAHALTSRAGEPPETFLARPPLLEPAAAPDSDGLGPWLQAFHLGQQAVLHLLGTDAFLRARALAGRPQAAGAVPPLHAGVLGEKGVAFALGFVDALEALRIAVGLAGAADATTTALLASPVSFFLDDPVGDPVRDHVVFDLFTRRPWLDGRASETHLRFPFGVELAAAAPPALDLMWVVGGAAEQRVDVESRLRAHTGRLTPGTVLLAADARRVPRTLPTTGEPGPEGRPPSFVDEGVAAAALYRFFGFTSFRDGQDRLLGLTLARQSCLGVLPTGAGKSVCFMLPALIAHGVTLVVTPLKALARDHLMNLERAGFLCAKKIDSDVPLDEQERIRKRCARGDLKLLFVTPERFLSRTFIDFLRMIRHTVPVAAFAIDEAHCVSEWGHDFRPAYLGLRPRFRELAPDAPIYAFTATASKHVRDDVLALLELTQDQLALPRTLDRPELSFSVAPTGAGSDPIGAFKAKLEDAALVVGSGPGQWVAYTPLAHTAKLDKAGRRLESAPAAADVLLEKYSSVSAYTGNMAPNAQEHIHRDFKDGKIEILVATKAFGMGIDVPSIRIVAHTGLTASVEQYYQEAGRAGRDGRRAHAMLHVVPRPRACQSAYPAGSTVPPCAALPYFSCVPPFAASLGPNRLCSFGLQINLLSLSRRGPLVDLYLLVAVAVEALRSGGTLSLVKLKQPLAQRLANWAGTPHTWIGEREKVLEQKEPRVGELVRSVRDQCGFAALESRWSTLAATSLTSEPKVKGAQHVLDFDATEVTRLLLTLRRLGLLGDFFPKFIVADGDGLPDFNLTEFELVAAAAVPVVDVTHLRAAGLLPTDERARREPAPSDALALEIAREIERFTRSGDAAQNPARLGLLVTGLHVAAQYRLYLRSRLEMLRNIESYAQTQECRKRFLLGYFEGFPYAGSCCRCDACGYEGVPTFRSDLDELARATAELDGIVAEAEIGPDLVRAVNRLVALRAGAETRGRLSRQIEEAPNRIAAEVARALLEARLWAGRPETRATFQVQNRQDLDRLLGDCEARQDHASVDLLLSERLRWYPDTDAAWRRARAQALLAGGLGSASRRLSHLTAASDERLRALATALWLDLFVDECGRRWPMIEERKD